MKNSISSNGPNLYSMYLLPLFFIFNVLYLLHTADTDFQVTNNIFVNLKWLIYKYVVNRSFT